MDGRSLDLGGIDVSLFGLLPAGSPVGHGEQSREERDREEHEQHLVPAALVGEQRGPDVHAPRLAHPSTISAAATTDAATAAATAHVVRMAALGRTSRSATSCAITTAATWPMASRPTCVQRTHRPRTRP